MAGTLKANKAAEIAGFRPGTVEKAVRLWAKMDDSQREEFLRAIGEWR